ncbi:alpha/beta fold hydrolase [Leucobacter sp. W1153]|uniref:alpha/beta fold hydrolase n=1 Tax=Leucobacter sp. W1153 TaxID=3439064 RepID=UPI003F33351B
MDDAPLQRALSHLVPLRARFECEHDGQIDRALVLIDAAGVRLLADPVLVTDASGDDVASTEPAADLTARGPAAAWDALLAGEVSWAQATNAALGTLRVSGDPVAVSWLLPPLSRWFAGEVAPAALTDSADSTPEYLDVQGRYVVVDGVRAYYESGGAGVPVLLLHTAGRDNRQWHGVIERLAGHYRLYAPDLPGHGKSWPRGAEPCLSNIDNIARWLLAFMSAVGEERFIVAGTSVGGNLSLLLSAISSRVLGAVAFQGSDYTPTISATSLAMMTHSRVALQHSNLDFALSLVGERALPQARNFIEWNVREISPLAQQADLTAYTNTDIRERMQEIRCPVTLVHGDADWLATREMVEGAAARIVNSAALRFISLPGIGHYPHLEDPVTAAEIIDEMGRLVG